MKTWTETADKLDEMAEFIDNGQELDESDAAELRDAAIELRRIDEAREQLKATVGAIKLAVDNLAAETGAVKL